MKLVKLARPRKVIALTRQGRTITATLLLVKGYQFDPFICLYEV